MHLTMHPTMHRAMLLCVAALFPVLTIAQQEQTDIQSLLRAWGAAPDPGSDSSVAVSWGLPDAKAAVGKIFNYTLPAQAFKGPVNQYLVSEVGRDTLPDWMSFDSASQSIVGIASPQELGQMLFIEVKALGDSGNTTTVAKDMFGVKVNEDQVRLETEAVPLRDLSSDVPQPVKCSLTSSVTKASVVVDADHDAMNLVGKLDMLRGMCHHLGMPADLMRVLPVTNRDTLDNSALVAGPGDVKEAKHPGVLLEWEVGCGNVQAAHMPMLTTLETTAGDGSMSNAVGHGIVGWKVTNHKAPPLVRVRRQVQYMATATAEASMGLPTGRPVATYTITEPPATKETPIAPTPTFTDSKPTRSRGKGGRRSRTRTRSRKHRTKTKGRHHHRPTQSPTHTATRNTAMSELVRPTSVLVEVSATLEPTVTHIQPSFPTPTLGISRTMDILEPSLTMTQTPSIAATSTEFLPTRSYDMDDVISTSPISPSESSTILSTPTQVTPEQTDRSEPTDPSDDGPSVKNFLPRLNLKQGSVFSHPIPANTFEDYEDGDTRNLKLLLTTTDGLTLPPGSWISLNKTSQVLYGLPMDIDVGQHELHLSAIDQEGQIATLVVNINVQRHPRKQNSHEFALTLDMSYMQFTRDMNLQIETSQKVAKIYGDPDTSNILVTRVESGSVIYAWANSSLPTDSCPIEATAELLSKLITPNRTLTEEAIEAMQPHRILRVESIPLGACGDQPRIQVETAVPLGPVEKPGEDKDKEENEIEKGDGDIGGKNSLGNPRETSQEDVLINTVVPAVVIAAMLLLAGLIACILYRKSRKGKLSADDQRTFITKGIPVIFAEELDEKPEHPTKPLLLDEEKPPLPPPQYPGSSMSGSQLSTPRSDHKLSLYDTDTDGEMTPYQPPGPPMTGHMRGSRGKNSQQAAYRNPPPYVPP